MKKIFTLLLAVGVVGSVFAAGDEILPDPLDSKDPRNITMKIHELVANGYIKPKDGVKIAWSGNAGYVVINEKTGSHFLLTNDCIRPISIKGRTIQENELRNLAVPVATHLNKCDSIFDDIKKVECMLNFAANM